MPRVSFLPLLLALPLIASCGEGAAPLAPAAKTPGAEADPGYLAPPTPTGARLEGGQVVLSGQAPPGARVRLATPEGEARFAQADAKGAWRLALPVAAQARIFGLSAVVEKRTVQGEGYVLLTPTGEPVLLRAGAGALRLGGGGSQGVDAVDFDREGGAVVSGRAPAGAALSIHIDGRKFGEGRADGKGRYALALTQQPLAAGARQIDVFGDATENPVVVDATPAPQLSEGPFRAASVAAGLRVDWMTPGGGAQSTILLK